MTGSVALPPEQVEQMQRHAQATYPQECCGFLVGTTEGVARTIRRTIPASNQVAAEKERRYIIPPAEFIAMERALEGTEEEVVGFYHSHPDHPARPSEFDRDHAWPWYTYIVLAVDRSGPGSWGAFELDPDSLLFREVAVRVERSLPVPNGSVSKSS